MRKRSMMASSLSGSPKRVLSQMSIHDLPNMYIISHDYENDNLGEMLTESLNIGKLICSMIVKKASNIILEKQILDQLIPYGWNWSCYLTNMIIKDIEEDDNYVSYIDEHEPSPCPIEHWRRMIGQVQNPKPLVTENRQIRRESKFQTVEFKRKQSERIETLPVKTGELDEDIDFDTEIESMRQAKARQILTQQQKQMSDMIKLQESIEMNRQLKRLNVDSKSKYTYDFEGRVIVQKPPDVERYPKAYHDMQEKKILLEVKDLYPNHKKQLETINNFKKKTLDNNQTNLSVSSRYSQSQLEAIQLQQGVTFKEGKNEKKNERHLSLMDIKDPKDLQKTLSSMKLKMSREEYSLITNTNLQSSFTSKQQTVQIIQQITPLYQQPQPAPSINGDFSVQSLNSSILQKLNGTISIISDHLDELIIHDPLPNITPTSTKLPQIPKPPIQAPHHLITEPTSIGLSNSMTKLPKALFVPGTFSRIIPKYPRERISKIARSFKQ